MADRELDRAIGQAKALAEERNLLREQLTSQEEQIAEVRLLKEQLESKTARVGRRNEQLKSLRREARRARRLLEVTEDRCFQMGYDEAVSKASSVGLDYKLLLEEGMSDPVTREAIVDEPPSVSSGADEDLSE